MSVRTEKVAAAIKKAIAPIISSLAPDKTSGLITVTAVRVTSDLQTAKVYVSCFGGTLTPGSLIELLENNKKILKSELAHQVRLRHTPELKFYIDDTLDQMEHIQKLLDSVKH